MAMGKRLESLVELLRHAKQQCLYGTFNEYEPFHFAGYRLSGLLNAQIWETAEETNPLFWIMPMVPSREKESRRKDGARCIGTPMPACNLSTRNIGK